MNLVTWIVVAGVFVAFLVLKRLTWVGPTAARGWLKKGALVIDVRGNGEYQERHLPCAINIPLGQLQQEITQRALDQEQPLLLHCLSGTRSGMGRRILKQAGYHHVFNLGSYGRAEKILAAQGGHKRRG
jgi:rhodanese-related sulfurtransferase